MPSDTGTTGGGAAAPSPAARDRVFLQQHFGRSTGAWLHAAANGIEMTVAEIALGLLRS